MRATLLGVGAGLAVGVVQLFVALGGLLLVLGRAILGSAVMPTRHSSHVPPAFTIGVMGLAALLMAAFGAWAAYEAARRARAADAGLVPLAAFGATDVAVSLPAGFLTGAVGGVAAGTLVAILPLVGLVGGLVAGATPRKPG